MRLALAAALLITANQASAQSLHTFEVSSVKPSRPGGPSGSSLDASHFSCSGITLLGLIMSAYRIPAWRVSGGPPWLSTESWDIAATLPPNVPTDKESLQHEVELMLQALVADRFDLSTHRETRDQPTYALVVTSGGSKLKTSAASTYSAKRGSGHLELHHATMAAFVSYLYTPQAYGPQAVDRPVVDLTGLTGFFDLTLDWVPDSSQPDASGPSLFTALQEQTGLRLEPRKSAVEFLIIDRSVRPREN